ncbi:hypothetical protein AMECASPLE_006214 [Ameca splendens]|uniref:Uncharacterized protein n=1 Tax=Ameca splendens TaxID=208324 RepID=A0ABV0XNB5_9TELE
MGERTDTQKSGSQMKEQESKISPQDCSPPSRRGTANHNLIDGSPRSVGPSGRGAPRGPGQVEAVRLEGTMSW